MCSLKDPLLRCFLAGVGLSQVADNVLDHNHRAVHYHSEVERAQRQQVGRNLSEVETNGCEQQRKRNGQSHD